MTLGVRQQDRDNRVDKTREDLVRDKDTEFYCYRDF